MNFYSQINNSEHINKFYGTMPDGSGFSTMPYNLGWVNKYGPKPHGLPINSYGSYLASNGYLPNATGIALLNSTNGFTDIVLYGPYNAIYEVEFSGIQADSSSNPARCVDCDSLNVKRLVSSNNGDDTNHLLGQTQQEHVSFPSNDPWWKNYFCIKEKTGNLCGYKTLYLKLAASGGVQDSMFIYLETELVNAYGFSRTFRKDFGFISQTDPMQNYLKPLMLEGTHVLTPVDSNPGSGEFGCDYTSAVCLVRPYKSNFYDIPNVLTHFSSGNNYYHDGNVAFLTTTQAGYRTNVSCSDLTLYSGDYIASGSGNRDYLPMVWNLSFAGVTGSLSGTCRPCNEYYSHNFKLSSIANATTDNEEGPSLANLEYSGLTNNFTTTYFWSGANSYIRTKPGGSYHNMNFYHICDFGCNELYNLNNNTINNNYLLYDNPGASLSRQGPCNNQLQMDLITQTSGIYTWMDAIIYFGSYYVKNGGTSTEIGNQVFYKKMCDDRTSNRCTTRYTDLVGFNRTVGNLNCFDYSVWSSGWSLINPTGLPYPVYGVSIVSSGLDITNSCNFSVAQPIITPFIPNTKCRTLGCHVCDGYGIPQSAAVSLNTSSGVFNWILSLNDTFGAGLSSSAGVNTDGGWSGYSNNCNWGDDADVFWVRSSLSTGTFTKIGKPVIIAGTVSNGYVIANAYWNNIPETGYTVHVCSGLNTGGNINWKIDCNNALPSLGGSSITFQDITDIRTYL